VVKISERSSGVLEELSEDLNQVLTSEESLCSLRIFFYQQTLNFYSVILPKTLKILENTYRNLKGRVLHVTQ